MPTCAASRDTMGTTRTDPVGLGLVLEGLMTVDCCCCQMRREENQLMMPGSHPLTVVYNDELIHAPVLVASVREVPPDCEGDLLLPQLLHRDLMTGDP